MPHMLDNYLYPLDPRAGGFSGVQPVIARADVATFGGNISLYWPAVLSDTIVREEWAQMDGAQYRAFDAKFRAGGGGLLYDWSPGDGVTYQVEIVGLDGRPYKGDTYTQVRMALKVHAIID